MNTYVVYDGDDVVAIGNSAQECAEQLGVTARTILFYSTPVYARRNPNGRCTVIVKPEDIEEQPKEHYWIEADKCGYKRSMRGVYDQVRPRRRNELMHSM